MKQALRRRFSQLPPVAQHCVQQAAQRRFAGAADGFVSAPVSVPAGKQLVAVATRAAVVLRQALPARRDAAANRSAIIDALVAFMAPDGTIAVGHATLAGRTAAKVSRSCVGAHLRALERAGVLNVVMRGCSKLVNGCGRDFCPIYVVIEDEPDEVDEVMLEAELAELDTEQRALHERLKAQLEARSRHLPVGLLTLTSGKGSSSHLSGEKSRRESDGPRTPVRRTHPERFIARTAAERSQSIVWLAQVLQLDLPHFGVALRKATAAFFAADWTGEAILYAIRHTPDGAQDWSRPVDGYSPMGVVNTRLKRWRRHGVPVAAPVTAVEPRRGPQPQQPEQPDRAVPLYAPRRMGERAAAAVASLRAHLSLRRDVPRAAGR